MSLEAPRKETRAGGGGGVWAVPPWLFFHNGCVFNASHLCFGAPWGSHDKANAVGVTHPGLEKCLRLGKKRPFKHKRQKGVWSGFERDFVTCSPYVSAFHQLCSDLKQVASLPNKPQLLQHLLRCNLCCQCVENPYMGQNRDRLTRVVSEGRKKGYGLLCTGGQLALHALLGLFSWQGFTASLIYFLLLRWAKCWFWPFCLHPQRSFGRACLYFWLGAWQGCLASRWGMHQLPGLLPTAEFRDSGKTLVPCLVL